MSLAESVGDDSSFKEGKKINSTLQWLRPLIAAPQPRAKVVAKASPLQFCCPPLSLGRNFRGKRLVIECKKKKRNRLCWNLSRWTLNIFLLLGKNLTKKNQIPETLSEFLRMLRPSVCYASLSLRELDYYFSEVSLWPGVENLCNYSPHDAEPATFFCCARTNIPSKQRRNDS